MQRGRSQRQPAAAAGLELAVVSAEAIAVSPLPLSGHVTLGRADDCEIHIDDRSVSRRHAILHLGPPLAIEDLGGVNGTFVRDQRSSPDGERTHPLRRVARARVEILVGERVNLGTVTIVVRRGRAEPDPQGTSVGDAEALIRDTRMRELYAQAARVGSSSIGVLILGETGVGKEVLARAIHASSPRARAPFLELNCAALPPALLESELFGHEKNAFTGAAQARAGLLESADSGTIFLDEIGELPLSVQVKLLRVLEDHKVLRIGGRAARKLDVRFIAATNRDLEAEIARGTFRQDLYFRLNGVAFVIPPLRERQSEIDPLAERFLDAASRRLDHRRALVISPETSTYLRGYNWPGNVRELRHVIERAAILCAGDTLLPADLPAHMTGVRAARSPATADSVAPEKLDERRRILDALEACAGNQTRAAQLLGMSLRTLVSRLAEHDLPRPRKRS